MCFVQCNRLGCPAGTVIWLSNALGMTILRGPDFLGDSESNEAESSRTEVASSTADDFRLERGLSVGELAAPQAMLSPAITVGFLGDCDRRNGNLAATKPVLFLLFASKDCSAVPDDVEPVTFPETLSVSKSGSR